MARARYNPRAENSLVAKNEMILHEAQWKVFNTPSRFKVVVAGRRWGKTKLALAKLNKMAKVPKRLIWYVSPSYRMSKAIMWYDLLASIPRRWIRGSPNETTMTLDLINGTRIECKGADKPDSLRGVGLHYVVLDEFQDMKDETWSKVLRPTLASTGGHGLIIGTPKGFTNLYDMYKLGQDKAHQKIRRWHSWQFPTITSPFIPREEIEEARRDMDEKSFRQEFEASFETMSGLVYYAYDRRVHVGDYPFNPNRPIWVGQDFNVDPMCSVILQPQENGEVWAVDELYIRNSNTPEVCDELERRYWRYLNKITIYPDPAGSYRQTGGRSDLDIFREKGFKRIKYHKKHPPVADRVNAVNRCFKSADGQIRLRIGKRCKHLLDSIEQTVYVEGTPDVDKKAGIEHSGDALGYPIQYEYPTRKIEIGGVSF